MSCSDLDPQSDDFSQPRPKFSVGQHDTRRWETLTDEQYGHILDAGFYFVTTPITNQHFRQRVLELCQAHLEIIGSEDISDEERANPSLPGPIIPTLTDEDTTLFPSNYVSGLVAYSSPWIDLCSENPLIAGLSKQILNLEIAYANFCGVRSVIIPGPRDDSSGKQIAQYGRAIEEAFRVATRVNLIIHMPMYREPGLEETEPAMGRGKGIAMDEDKEIDIYSAWDSWNTIRTMCDYSMRLFVAVRVPKRMPEIELQTRWFAEPIHYLTIGRDVFQQNKAGYPSLSKHHQEMLNTYMRLKNYPWIILHDVGPDNDDLAKFTETVHLRGGEYPSLADAHSGAYDRQPRVPVNAHISYMRHLEAQQPPFSALETTTLTSFQDWLQSPLQPLSDNLESSTYEMFEGDPVKYDQYEKAITEAMREWKELNKPTSSVTASGEPELVVAVAGAGRGPLMTRVLRASQATGVAIQPWALEKNQNAYVYLLRQNKLVWDGKVTVVKTDMREWDGPIKDGSSNANPKVDILVTELLGSFGDNELSPECLDGIQGHIAKPHGISIPESYTAHLSPISTPRIFADLSSRTLADDASPFDIPWVVRLFATDFVASKQSPDRPRFQQAWEFVHPVRLPFEESWRAKHGAKRVQRGGGGAMNLSQGLNEHNTRHCHLTFACRRRGVIHGLAGYFESVLYRPQVEGRELVEISTLPDEIDRKSKDMISWFPIFFPLKKPLYFPQDTEMEVSMWRQTDDTKVWYEWMVEAFTYVGPSTRVKVGASELHSSRKIACLM